MTRITSFLFATAMLMTHQFAAAEMRALEQAIESSSTYLSLPERIPSAVTLAGCDNGCPSSLLQLTTESKFFVDGNAVSYPQLRTAVEHTGLNVSVFFDARSNAITRIVVFASNQ
jgi:hypothetical protein